MPLYEYRCENCGKVFEVMQKFSDAPLTAHEACGGGPVTRLVSAPAFQFKGSGWYVTDYAKSSSSSPSSPANGEGNKSKPEASSSSGENSKSSNSESGAAKPAASTSGSSEKS